MAPIRRAGTGRDPRGRTLWWTVAEGRRGRRWREAVVAGEGIAWALLLETDPDGRFSHLELASAAGLLTLHPEPDGTLHGNVLTADGLEHVVGWPWPAGAVLLIEGSPAALAAAVLPLAGTTDARLVRIDPATLRLEAVDARVEQLGHGRWQLGDEVVRVDGAGLPELEGASGWPLEG